MNDKDIEKLMHADLKLLSGINDSAEGVYYTLESPLSTEAKQTLELLRMISSLLAQELDNLAKYYKL